MLIEMNKTSRQKKLNDKNPKYYTPLRSFIYSE
jgi:hypothetical protein